MGKIYAVASIKGGAGKSTTAQALAFHLVKAGQKTLLVDSDAQKTTAQWAQDRADNPELIAIPCIELTGKTHSHLERFAEDYDAVVVDCGGADSMAGRSALVVADAVLVPCQPKKRDYGVAQQTADVIETARLHNTDMYVASVITIAPHLQNQASRILKAKDHLVANELNPLKAFFVNRLAIDNCSEDGRTIQESGDDKAEAEAIAVFDEFLGAIKNG